MIFQFDWSILMVVIAKVSSNLKSLVVVVLTQHAGILHTNQIKSILKKDDDNG